MPVRREERGREPAQILSRAEQPGVPADPAKRERVSVVHLPPDHTRTAALLVASPLVAVSLRGRDARQRHPWPVPGRTHPERPEHLAGS